MSASPVGKILAGQAALATFLIFACAVLRTPLEADPVPHMLLQLPLLAWAGWLLADAISPIWPDAGLSRLNDNGIPGLLIVLFAIAFWMLPRSIDGALTSIPVEIAKFITVPLLIGLPLRWSWYRASPLLRGVLKSNALSMLGVLAWLYSAAPVRVCNSYLVEDQKRLSIAFLGAAIGLAILWSARLFFPPAGATTGKQTKPVRRKRFA